MNRPQGPGLYQTINLGAYRRDDVHATHTHGNPLQALPDNQRTAEAIARRALAKPTAAQVQRELARKLEGRR